MRVAVVGSGGAGLGAAWALTQEHEVVLFEARGRAGGHAYTVDTDGPAGAQRVDTGFIVFNETNYPKLSAFLSHLGVASRPADMSFSASLDGGRFEYRATPLGLFAQPWRALRPAHWTFLRDLLRFYRESEMQAAAAAEAHGDDDAELLGQWLERQGYGPLFREAHLKPLVAAIWSAPPGGALDFPLLSFLRFFASHGLLRRRGRPQWRSIDGGSSRYIEAALAAFGRQGGTLRLGCAVAALNRDDGRWTLSTTEGARDRFDAVVLACHADQALRILGQDASEAERLTLAPLRYAESRVVLHRDPALMPRRRRVWSSWNYVAPHSGSAPRSESTPGGVSVTYWMNRLQGLDPRDPLFISLNPAREPRDETVIYSGRRRHPLFDRAALAAQRRLPQIQGRRGLWFAGSYCGHGFHEDALSAGLAAASALGCPAPWFRPAATDHSAGTLLSRAA